MTDGTTDAAINEQEVIYLLYLDPDVFEPRISFFYLQELHGGQNAEILKKAIEDAFRESDMEDALQKNRVLWVRWNLHKHRTQRWFDN